MQANIKIELEPKVLKRYKVTITTIVDAESQFDAVLNTPLEGIYSGMCLGDLEVTAEEYK